MKYLLIATLLFAACSRSQTAPSVPPSTPEPVPVAISLMQVVEVFNNANLPMDKAVVYDERTDPNSLLGRPGRYVEKMNFTDTRVKDKNRRECSIEIFTNEADAKNRFEYLETIGRSGAMFDSYKFLHKNVLVRVDLKLVPSEADEYKKALESLK